MKHFASPKFWEHYDRLPAPIRKRADRAFELLKRDPWHPSLRFEKKGRGWSVRVDDGYRALAKDRPEGMVWIWIGNHDDYERLIRSLPRT